MTVDESQSAVTSNELFTGVAGSDAVQKEIASVLSGLFGIMLPTAVLFGGIVLSASLYGAIKHGWRPDLFLHTGIYLTVFVILLLRRRLSVSFLYFSMLGLAFSDVAVSLYHIALPSAGMISLATLAVLTGIIFGKRAGMMTVAGGVLMVSLFGIGYCSGMLKININANEYLMMPITWIIVISCSTMYVVLLVLASSGMQRRVAKLLSYLKDTVLRLEEEISRRKMMENELLICEEKYKYIFDNAIMGVFQSAPEGYYLNVNSAFARLHGFDSPRELINGITNIGSELYVNSEDYARYLECLERDGAVEKCELEVRHKSGETFWLLANARNVRDGKGETLYYEGTVQNITDWKRAEEALRESESKFRQLAERSIVGVCLIQDDIFRYVNARFAEICECGVERIIDQLEAKDLVFPADWPLVRENLSRNMNEGESSVHYQFRMVTRKGRIKDIEVYGSCTVYRGKPATMGTLLDITERKQAETALQESEERYRNIFENAVEGILQSTHDGRLLNANPALAKMMGFASPSDMVAQISDLGQQIYIHSEDRLRFLEQLEERGFVEGLEVQMYRKDRKIIWTAMSARGVYDDEKRLIRIDSTIEDITHRKSVEQALLESEAKYRSVVESSLAGFYIIQDDLFRFVNRRFCEITGYSYDEVVNTMPYLELIHPEERRKVSEHIEKRLMGETGNAEYAFRVVRKDGEVITVKLLGGFTSHGGRLALSGTFIDITREKSMESQLRQAQKMEAIGTLAGGIAHDFNNVLTALIGYGTMLQCKLAKDDLLRLYADQILSASHKAASLTQSLLAFSRKQPLASKPVNMNGIIKGTEELLRRLITEDINLETVLAKTDLVIRADTTQIDQILFNLTTNARDAMPQGGTLRIATEPAMLDSDFVLAHGFGKGGRYACLSVSDTGVGMDRETVEKIFDPFFTTKEVGRGTGLGLCTVYGIVKQHGGYITVASERDKGTSFHIYLPMAKTKAEDEQTPTMNLRGGKETILVAEDNEDVRLFIGDILGQYGYAVIEAVDGQDAIGKFRQDKEIDLVILDSIMPRQNGRETYETMRSLAPTTRFLFISGYTSDIILEKGIGERDVDFIPKPLEPNKFLEKIREILDREE